MNKAFGGPRRRPHVMWFPSCWASKREMTCLLTLVVSKLVMDPGFGFWFFEQ